jgi:DNA-nicking Smr family endonuclease
MGKSGKSDEDAALWDKITSSASPLKRREPRAATNKTPAAPPPAKPTPPKPPPSRGTPKLAAAAAPKPGPVPRAGGLDRQTARQLDKGRLEVEARLDLHGLRQRDAHAQLHRFLKSAQARGQRHVLVITGKGAPVETRASFYDEEERGVLRNAVPRWLAEPEFAPLVVSFAPAPRRLGGDGALYVRLRKPRTSR